MLAEREDLAIQTVQANMTQMFPFEDNSFDIIFNPVSNIFIEELTPCGMSLLSTETWWNTNYLKKIRKRRKAPY